MRKFALASAASLALLPPAAIAAPSAQAVAAHSRSAVVPAIGYTCAGNAKYIVDLSNGFYIVDGSGRIAYETTGHPTNLCWISDSRHSGWKELVQYGTNFCLSANTNTTQVYFATCGQVPAQDWWYDANSAGFEQLNMRAWLTNDAGTILVAGLGPRGRGPAVGGGHVHKFE